MNSLFHLDNIVFSLFATFWPVVTAVDCASGSDNSISSPAFKNLVFTPPELVNILSFNFDSFETEFYSNTWECIRFQGPFQYSCKIEERHEIDYRCTLKA